MKLSVAVYNVEWMVNLFTRDGEPKTTGEDGIRSSQLAEVVKAVDPDMHIIVMGDINDGFGMDYYEQRFCRSAVETLLGDVWSPDKILQHVLAQPKLGKYGWTPSSSRFQDRLTGDKFNVLIDHILVSRGISVTDARVWNPFLDQETVEKTAKVKAIKEILLKASDHFPVSAVLEL